MQNKYKQSGGSDHVVAINWDVIREEYETTEISLSDLADEHGVKYPTIKSRKQRQESLSYDIIEDGSIDGEAFEYYFFDEDGLICIAELKLMSASPWMARQ